MKCLKCEIGKAGFAKKGKYTGFIYDRTDGTHLHVAPKACALTRAATRRRVHSRAQPRAQEGVRGRLYRDFSGSVDLWLDRKKNNYTGLSIY